MKIFFGSNKYLILIENNVLVEARVVVVVVVRVDRQKASLTIARGRLARVELVLDFVCGILIIARRIQVVNVDELVALESIEPELLDKLDKKELPGQEHEYEHDVPAIGDRDEHHRPVVVHVPDGKGVRRRVEHEAHLKEPGALQNGKQDATVGEQDLVTVEELEHREHEAARDGPDEEHVHVDLNGRFSMQVRIKQKAPFF
jgi:hypothetical protein